MNNTFDRKTKETNFQINDLVLNWDARKEDKHGNFYHLWRRPHIIIAYRGDNSFILQNQNEIDIGGGPINGRFPKNYLS